MNLYRKYFIAAFLITSLGLSACSSLTENSLIQKLSNFKTETKNSNHAPKGKHSKADKDLKTVKENQESINSHKTDQISETSQISGINQITETKNNSNCSAKEHSNFVIKKRVAILRFPVSQRQNIVDISRIEEQYAQVLAAEINQKTNLIAVDGTQHHAMLRNDHNLRPESALSPEVVQQAAMDLETQFVVAGRFLDLAFDKSDARTLDLITNLQAWKNLAHNIYQKNTGTYLRNLDIELGIYDGFTGEKVSSRRISKTAHQKITPGAHDGLNSRKFQNSHFGEALSQALQEQVSEIDNQLECIPYQTYISHIHGNTIEIPQGHLANIEPGMTLRIFRKNSVGSRPNAPIKFRWEPYGEAVVDTVTANSAIATATNEHPKVLRPGDVVRAW